MRFAAVMALAAIVVGCEKNPPLPPDLPKPDPKLMVDPSKTPLPDLPENKAGSIDAIYANSVRVRGQCVVDRRRLADLQKYVSKLTNR